MKTNIIIILFLFFGIYSPASAEMIDGPAVIFESIKGKQIGMLDDGAPVRVISRNAGWIELELKYDGSSDLLKVMPLKKKLNLSRKIYGMYGYINPESQLKIRQIKKTSFITVFTIEGNLKDKILYYKNYKALEKDINKIDFTFSDIMPIKDAASEFSKYENEISVNDDLSGSRLFVEVGYYRGIPTVIRSFDFISSAGGAPELILKDSFFINERGLLKSSTTGNVDIKNTVCNYYKDGAFRIFKSEYNINAPASYYSICSYMIPAGNGKYEVGFTAKMNNEMQRYVNAVSIIKYSLTGIDLTFRAETKNIEEAFKILKSHEVFGDISAAQYGINFNQEIKWLDYAIRN